MSMWNSFVAGFKAHLQLEKSLSPNSVEAYVHDVVKLTQFLEASEISLGPDKLELRHFQDFLRWITELGMTARTQARVISGLKSFYSYLMLENLVKVDPTEMLESPKTGRKLPVTLDISEIDRIFNAIDLSTNEGKRNRAMLETLYGCGLRVSELVNLRISCLFFNEGFVKVIGKGDKDRLVPSGSVAQ